MGNRRPWAAQWPGAGLIKHKRPNMTRRALKSGETFNAGDFVGKSGTEVIALSGTDPTPIWGLATEGTASNLETGFVMLFDADDSNIFGIKGSRVPVAGDKGVEYGIVLDSDGIWILDLTETVNTRMNVQSVNVGRELYFVKVMTAHQA